MCWRAEHDEEQVLQEIVGNLVGIFPGFRTGKSENYFRSRNSGYVLSGYRYFGFINI